MICQNCQSKVDDDLIFCTNCGARLFQPNEETPTVVITEPRPTTPDKVKEQKSSNLKWVALIIALIAIPASIFGILLLQSRNQQVTVNAAKTNTPTATPTHKPSNTNQNANANVSNANANKANSNANANATINQNKIDVMNERIEIEPKEHYAVPFEIESAKARLKGRVTVVQGDKVEVFVYIKSEYDTYFPDPVHKVSSFETGKSEEANQVLVKEEYVLVFVNKSDKPLTIQGNFDLQPMDEAGY